MFENVLTTLRPRVAMQAYIADALLEEPTLNSGIANTLIERSPAHARLEHPRLAPGLIEREFSRVANFGSAVADMVFENAENIAYVEALTYSTKDARAARDSALECGRYPLLNDEADVAIAAARAAKAAIKDVAGGAALRFEDTLLFKAGSTWCRCRPDAMSEDNRLIIDLKITGTNVRECNRQFFGQGYDMQAAFYERAADFADPDGAGKREIIYLFVENAPPFAWAALQVSEGTMQLARKKMNAAVNIWAKCLKENSWPTYTSSQTTTSRPSYDETSWILREEMDPTIDVRDPT